MFGSIYIGLSGLAAYSRGLQVVSNNISNMNSLGFRSSGVTFGDVYSTGGSGGLDYGSQRGNGHGVVANDVTLNFNPGELRQTGRDLDLSIDGNGFFTLLDGDQTYYTRTGSFAIGEDGYVVLQGTDHRLAVLDDAGWPVALNIDSLRTDPPVATDRITLANNLSTDATSYTLSNIRVIGADGATHTWTAQFTRADFASPWTMTVKEGTRVIGDPAVDALRFAADYSIDPASENLTFTDSVSGLSVTFDFTAVRSFVGGDVSSLSVHEANGRQLGTIATLRVNQQGELEVAYTNQETRELGAIALADFRDPQALEQRSGGMFTYSGFGHRQYLAASDSRVGTVLGGRLEGSNVDLGAQFGDLILIQRGFQASSQVISVTNDMIQQLFGIRGQ